MLALRFDSLLVGFSGTSRFDFDDQSAFYFDTADVSFDAHSVTFDAGVAIENEILRFDASTGLDTTRERFDEV